MRTKATLVEGDEDVFTMPLLQTKVVVPVDVVTVHVAVVFVASMAVSELDSYFFSTLDSATSL